MMPTTDGEEIPVGLFNCRPDSIWELVGKKLLWEPSTVLVVVWPLGIRAVTEYLESFLSIFCSSGGVEDVYLSCKKGRIKYLR